MWINLNLEETGAQVKLREFILLARNLGKDKVYFLNECQYEEDLISKLSKEYDMEYEFLSLKEMVDKSPYEVTMDSTVKEIASALSKGNVTDEVETFKVTGRGSIYQEDYKKGLKNFKRIKY